MESKINGLDSKSDKNSDTFLMKNTNSDSTDNISSNFDNCLLAEAKDSRHDDHASSSSSAKRSDTQLLPLTINFMNMKDTRSQRLLWEFNSSKGSSNIFDDEIKEDIPKEILNCKSVSREINFSCNQEIKDFHIVQNVILYDQCIETWSFHFGYVIAGSTNSWQQIIEAAGDGEMIPAHVLSGNVIFETIFYDKNEIICKSKFRMYYV